MSGCFPPRSKLAFLLLLSCFISTLVRAQQGELGNIVGEVHVARQGFPARPVLVNLQNRGATITSVYTDSQGRFGFYTLPGGVYHLVVQDDDYVPADQEIILNPLISSIAYAQVMLSLKPGKEAGKDSAGRVQGSNPSVIDFSEYTRKFSSKAVKEYEKGLEASNKNNPDGAAKHFTKSLEIAPEFYPAHNELGRILMVKAQFPAAQHEFEEAIRLNQSDAEAHLNLGNVFLLTKKYDDALRNVQEGLRREPTSAVGQFTLGSIYERTGKYQDAEKALRQALKLDPRMSKVHLELVNLYLAQKRKPEAASELKAFLKDSPNDPFAPKAKEVLKKLDQN